MLREDMRRALGGKQDLGPEMKKKKRKKSKTDDLTMQHYHQSRRFFWEHFKKQARRNRERQQSIVPTEITEEMKSYVNDIQERPSTGSIRIYFQNVNTIKIGGRVEETETALKMLKGAEVSIFCLSEVNKNFRHQGVNNDMESLLQITILGTEY